MKIQHDVKHREAITMGHSTEVKSSLLQQNQKLAKDKAFSPRASSGSKPREEDKASKLYQQSVIAQHTAGRPLFSPKSSRYYQKPWPNKVPVGAEELVKHMSNVPGYLQRMERGDNLQDKALNFGVLGWQCLEKWTDNHRRVTGNKNVARSPASCNGSSAVSTFGLSSKSCRSSGGKHVAWRNQSPMNFHQDSSAEEDYALISEEASTYGMGYHSPEIAWRKCPARDHICGSAEHCLRMDNLASELEENRRNILDSQAVSYDVAHFSGDRTLPLRSKDCAALHFINGKLKSPEVVSDCRERGGESGHGWRNNSLSTVVNRPQDHYSELSQLNDGTLDYSQESIQGSQRFSFGSVESAYTMPTESGRTSFVGSFSYEEFQSFTPNAPHSCPLTSDAHRSEWSAVNVCVSEHGEASEGSCYLTNSPPQSGELATVKSNGWHGKHDKFAIKPRKIFGTKTPENWSWSGVKRVPTTGRELLHNNHSCTGPSCMVGSSRSRETSDRRQLKWTLLSDGHNGDKAVDNSRARRSPLRRLLDPLLKPKAFNQTHTAKLAAGSPRRLPSESKIPIQEELLSTCELHGSTQASTHSCGSNSVKGFISSGLVPMGNHGSVYDEKHEASTKQTLLQFAWKNGLPLFTFSVNESDILAATRKKATPGKEGCECIYTFYLVCETKKKTGGWINQGNKSKRKGLVSSIVGQMNVSCIKGHENCSSVREFVLFGPELRPSFHGTLEPLPDSELAAIIVQVTEENVESFVYDLPQNNNCRDLSRRKLEKDKYAFHPTGISESEQNTEKNAPKMVVILPSEVHGLSGTGKPSPLVDRWRSKGLCDCGGWDAGCSLTILSNNLQDSSSGSVQSCHTTDGTHRVELVIQGVSQESEPVFSLVVFKEGLYTVDFHASIAPLQAFAVCIAILHSRISTGLYELQNLQ